MKKGQVLARLDAQDANLNVAAARAILASADSDLEFARAALARHKDLRDRNFVSQGVFDQKDNAFKAASFAYTSTAFPMLTGTLVTAAGFLPIATARSSTGEYTLSIFQVVLTAPLGLIGVSAALLISGKPFGFVALLGFIALSGMIMRNSVILIDQIEQDIKSGHKPWNAVIDATVRRFRPIVLTALAAILTMIPLARSVFFGPMAVVIMGGPVRQPDESQAY